MRVLIVVVFGNERFVSTLLVVETIILLSENLVFAKVFVVFVLDECFVRRGMLFSSRSSGSKHGVVGVREVGEGDVVGSSHIVG